MEIQHYIHKHPVLLIEKGDSRSYCRLCDKSLSSRPTYCCKGCGYFVHKSCADEPKEEIQSLFHACPLVRYAGSPYNYFCNVCLKSLPFSVHYRCKLGCYCSVHVECALIKPIKEYSTDDGQEGCIQHLTHFHPLKPLLNSNHSKQVVCAICQNLCSSSSSSSSCTYGCMECKFFLHKSCMTSLSLQFTYHRIHPCNLVFLLNHDFFVSCGKCRKSIGFGSMSLGCTKCRFSVHVKCVLLPAIDSENAQEIQHFIHPHPLLLIQNNQGYACRPRCVACAEICSTTTPTFKCSLSSCNNFFLHKSCGLNLPYLPQYHPCHPQHLLAFKPLPYNHHDIPDCNACWKGFDSSHLAFSCPYQDCEFNLHLDCAKLFPSIVFKGHEHNLTFHEKAPHSVTCPLCGVNCCDNILRCVPCDFNIHIQCLPSAPQTINHKSHLHPLTLTNSPFEFELKTKEDAYNSDDEFYCDDCEKKRNKKELVYYCADCKFIVQVNCVISSVLPFITKDNHSLDNKIPNDDYATSQLVESCSNVRSWKIEYVEQKVIGLEGRKQKLEEELDQLKRELDTMRDLLLILTQN